MLYVVTDVHSNYCVPMIVDSVGFTGERAVRLFVKNVGDRFGVPANIRCDRGPQFISEWWTGYCEMQGIQVAYAQAGRHHTIGAVENMGKQLRKAINMALQLTPESEWTKLVTPCAQALHAVPGPTGWSPYELYMGRKPPIPGLPKEDQEDTRDVTEFLRQRRKMHKAAQAVATKLQDLAAKAYNQRRGRARQYEKGDYVWIQRRRGGIGNKEGTYWQGPYKVADFISQDVYVVVGDRGGDVATEEVHVDIMYPFAKLKGSTIPLEFTKELETRHRQYAKYPDYVPRDILGHRINTESGKLEFRTRWQGFTKDWITWEPVTSFIGDVTTKWTNYCSTKGLSWT